MRVRAPFSAPPVAPVPAPAPSYTRTLTSPTLHPLLLPFSFLLSFPAWTSHPGQGGHTRQPPYIARERFAESVGGAYRCTRRGCRVRVVGSGGSGGRG